MRFVLLVVLVCGACAGEDRAPRDGGSTSLDGSLARVDAGGRDRSAPLAPDASDECAGDTYAVSARPLDMLILLDQSGSMKEDEDRWTPVTQAIEKFVRTPALANTSVGIQYFPLGSDDDEKCDLIRYATPDVELGALPGNATAIVSSIAAHWFSQEDCCDTPEHAGTPTRPAVEGSARHLARWLESHPTHAGVLLLATDGEPSDVCEDNEVEDVAQAIAAATQGTPSIKTYVIGIGENDALDEMAAAGGTGEGALIVDGSGALTEQQLLDALARIRAAALPCDFPLQRVDDPHAVNVEWSSASQPKPTTLRNVPSAEHCSKTTSGWFYDDVAQPTRVNLCPDLCKTLGSDPSAMVRIVQGCQTVIAF
jgi:hypothetical protein